MKKIIYSLVIMIAAGSLFTSCIEQVEPAGILDLRQAKAEYIRSLTKLREADAALQNALAAVEQANARYRDAETAYKNAETDSLKEIAKLQAEYQRLVNEAKAIENDFLREEFKVKQQEVLARIAAIKQEMENNEKQHEIDLVKYQQKLAEAQENLRVALRNIALASKELTSEEAAVLNTLVNAYKNAFDDVSTQTMVVMRAQKAYDDAVAKKDSVDLVWDSESHQYVNKIDLWSKKIQDLRDAQEKYRTALENVPTQPTIEEWDEYLKKYREDSIAWAMKRWQNTKDSATLMVAVHDADEAYAELWDAYVNGYDLYSSLAAAASAGELQPDGYYSLYGYPVYTQITPTEPEDPKGATTYTVVNKVKVDDVTYNPGDVVGKDVTADVITTFPKLKIGTSAAFAKFNALLASYTAPATFTYYDADGNAQTQTITLVDNSGADYVVNAALDMKDYLIATAATNTVSSGKGAKLVRQDADGNDFTAGEADYGLKGAVDVLERWMVLVDGEAKDWAKEETDAKKAWEDARAALAKVYAYGVKKGSDNKTTWGKIAATATPKKEAAKVDADATKLGVTKPDKDWSYLYEYKPYKDALDAAKTAGDDYDKAVKDSTDAMAALIAAVENYMTQFNGWANTPADFDQHDSDAIWAAMKTFILARAAYLDKILPAESVIIDKYGKQENPKFYYYAKRSDVSPAEVDSIAWTKLAELDYKDFRKQEDRGTYGKDSKYAFYAKEGDPNDGKVPSYCLYKNAVFTMIGYQLFNTAAFTGLYSGTPLTDPTVPANVLAFINDVNGRAIYGTPSFQPFVAQLNSDGDVEIVGNDPTVKSTISSKETTYKNKIKAVRDAIAAYQKLYQDYWGLNAGPDKNKELNPECYDAKSFTEPYQITVFNGTTLEPTAGVQVILGSVDPKATVADGSNFTQITPTGAGTGTSQIFGIDKESLFHKYMYAMWMNANNDATTLKQDLAKIKAWVENVEKYFATCSGELSDLAKKVYEADKARYDQLVANAAIYYKLYADLVGGEFTNPLGEKCIMNDMVRNLSISNPFICNFVDPETGEWLLEGKQLEWAKACFGEDFNTKYAALYATEQEIQDEIDHNNIILNAMKPAYTAAAKIANYNHLTDWKGNDTTFYQGDDWYALMAEYELAHEKYVNQLNEAIETAEGKIDKLMKKIADFTSGVPEQEIEIAQKAEDLAQAQFLLAKYEARLEKVKEALDSLLAYLQGTGAEFILPSADIPGATGGNSGKIVGPSYDFGGTTGATTPTVGGLTLDDIVAWIKSL